MSRPILSNAQLDALQRAAFDYFLYEVNLANGLIADNNQPNVPASIAAVGLGLSAYPVGVERGWMTREQAAERTLAALRFFWTSPQGTQPDAAGYKGFYYHFLDMQTGRRAWQCELSTIDSAFLFAGILASATYFTAETADEHEIRTLADALYRRADWHWVQHGGAAVSHGWKPEHGFLPYRWEGYNEALVLYALGLGADPTYALPEASYAAWTATYEWKQIYDCEYLFSGPLFTHQLSHVWIDFRGIQDAFMRDRGSDYFENSRRATYVQQQYAIRNPLQFAGYGADCWGLTASDGPGWVTLRIQGRERHFFGYLVRGVPDGPDDGTIAPWATVASLTFAPEIVLPALQHFEDIDLGKVSPYGFKATFNPTCPGEPGSKHGWVCPWHYGLNQGPLVLMIENYRSGLLWRLMRQCPYLAAGLRRAGFAGGWL